MLLMALGENGSTALKLVMVGIVTGRGLAKSSSMEELHAVSTSSMSRSRAELMHATVCTKGHDSWMRKRTEQPGVNECRALFHSGCIAATSMEACTRDLGHDHSMYYKHSLFFLFQLTQCCTNGAPGQHARATATVGPRT